MSRVCSVCGKKQVSGNAVSHSHRKTRRTWGANVHKIKVETASGAIKSEYICTRCLRTARKGA